MPPILPACLLFISFLSTAYAQEQQNAIDSSTKEPLVKSPGFWGQIMAIIALVAMSGIVAGSVLNFFQWPFFGTPCSHF